LSGGGGRRGAQREREDGRTVGGRGGHQSLVHGGFCPDLRPSVRDGDAFSKADRFSLDGALHLFVGFAEPSWEHGQARRSFWSGSSAFVLARLTSVSRHPNSHGLLPDVSSLDAKAHRRHTRNVCRKNVGLHCLQKRASGAQAETAGAVRNATTTPSRRSHQHEERWCGACRTMQRAMEQRAGR
jgi:hypothetical protein